MRRYSLSVRTVAAAAGAPFCDLRTPSGNRVYIREIGVFVASQATPAVSGIGLIRPNAVGTASTTQAGASEDPSEPAASGTLVGTVWSSAPTIAGTPAYLRKATLPATVGVGIIWTWQEGKPLIVPISSSLIVWNFHSATANLLDVYFVWEE